MEVSVGVFEWVYICKKIGRKNASLRATQDTQTHIKYIWDEIPADETQKLEKSYHNNDV